MFSASSDVIEFPVVVKADVQGSVEAIVTALHNLSNDEIRVRVLHSGVGAITESDVTLAAASKAPIIGFNVRPNAKAREIERAKVRMRYYDVIYHLTEEIAKEMAGELGPERIETVVGRAQVKEVFRRASATRPPVCWSRKASSARVCTRASRATTSSSRRPPSPGCAASRTTSPKSAPVSSAAWSWRTPTTSSRAISSRCSRSNCANGRCTVAPWDGALHGPLRGIVGIINVGDNRLKMVDLRAALETEGLTTSKPS